MPIFRHLATQDEAELILKSGSPTHSGTHVSALKSDEQAAQIIANCMEDGGGVTVLLIIETEQSITNNEGTTLRTFTPDKVKSDLVEYKRLYDMGQKVLYDRLV